MTNRKAMMQAGALEETTVEVWVTVVANEQAADLVDN